MYKTMMLTIHELVCKMRYMKIGEEIGLAQTANGEYSYGIRCLPGGMFDNGMCWLADYYGGGSTMAFSETQDEFMEDPDRLLKSVVDWLDNCDLLIKGDKYATVYVQRKDGSLPETKWEFKETKIEPENRLVCVNFDLRRPYHTYISVPANSTDEEIKQITREALKELTADNFDMHVISGAESLDPFIDDEDFVYMEIDPCYDLENGSITKRPVGTLSQ